MSKLTLDGVLSGVSQLDGTWQFEGVSYDTPATESDVISCANEALSEPDESVVEQATKLVFGGNATYTSQAVLAMAAAYTAEVGDGDGSDHVVRILREAARRIACVEALTI